MSRWAINFLIICVVSLVSTAVASPDPGGNDIRGPVPNPAFVVPPKLRPRVDFWKDIFSKYGEYQLVFHHRDYPQIVFAVLDFSRDAEELGPVALEKLMAREEIRAKRAINGALSRLADGLSPETDLERDVEAAMSVLPGGRGKYSFALDDEIVRSQVGIRERYAEAIRRSGRYMSFMERIFVEEYGLPRELTRLPFVESSFDYDAKSSVGASGIWQFMPRTAKIYMVLNNYVDERRDPIESTKAAARYLKSAYNALGTWPLAVTSYNNGVAGVAKKARMMGTTNIATLVEHPTKRVFGFASNNFFVELLAAIEVYEERAKLFPEVKVEPPIEFDEVRLSSAASVGYIAQKLRVPVEDLREANLALSEKVWSGRYKIPAGYNLKVPRGRALDLHAASEPEPAPTREEEKAGPFVYYVKKGDTLSDISKKVGIPVPVLKARNGLKSNVVRPGQRLNLESPAPPKKSKKNNR